MANSMNEDEKNLHALFAEAHDTYLANNIEDAKAGIELFLEELNIGNGQYGLVYYVNAMMAGFQLAEAIASAETEAEQEVA